MGYIQTYASLLWTGTDHAPKARQGKMTCDVSHLCQIISSHTCLCMYILHKW